MPEHPRESPSEGATRRRWTGIVVRLVVGAALGAIVGLLGPQLGGSSDRAVLLRTVALALAGGIGTALAGGRFWRDAGAGL